MIFHNTGLKKPQLSLGENKAKVAESLAGHVQLWTRHVTGITASFLSPLPAPSTLLPPCYNW